jgi:hypothetical protein
MRRIFAPFLFLLVLLPAACGSLPAPETNRERLAAAEVTFQAALQTANDLVAAGKLDEGAKARVGSALQAAYTALQAWRLNPDMADSYQTTLAALRAVQAVLNQFAPGEPT